MERDQFDFARSPSWSGGELSDLHEVRACPFFSRCLARLGASIRQEQPTEDQLASRGIFEPALLAHLQRKTSGSAASDDGARPQFTTPQAS